MPIEKKNQIAKVLNSNPLVFSQCCDCFDIYTSLFLVITVQNHNHYERIKSVKIVTIGSFLGYKSTKNRIL
jgi:hypothetical protein